MTPTNCFLFVVLLTAKCYVGTTAGQEQEAKPTKCRPNIFPTLKIAGVCMTLERLEECKELEVSESKHCPEGLFCCYLSPAQGNKVLKRKRKGQRKHHSASHKDTPLAVLDMQSPQKQNPGIIVPDVPATPAPLTEPPATPASATEAPATPAPETPAPETPAPETPAPETPAPETPAPETSAPLKEAPPVAVPEVPKATLGQSCGSVDDCTDAGTTCSDGSCGCWWDKGFSAADAWACNTDGECQRRFPGHVCRPTQLCKQFQGRMGFCIPTGALRQ